MTITLKLTAEQQRRFEAVEPAVEKLMRSRQQPTPDERWTILDEVRALLADSPSLFDEALPRARVYEPYPPEGLP